MSALLATIQPLYAEALLSVGAMALMLVGVYACPRVKPWYLGLALLLLVLVAYVLFAQPMLDANTAGGAFVQDVFTQTAKALMLLASVLVLLIGSTWLLQDDGQPFEYIVLLCFSLTGLMLLVSARDLIAIYVSLELSSLALYVLTAFARDTERSTEAGLKYFMLGALASGLLLFGMSLVYGFSATTSLAQLTSLVLASPQLPYGLMLGIVLMMVGFCFKLSAVPFHMWTPDVYEGAPTPTTALLATAPKVGMMALFAVFLLALSATQASHDAWQPILITISIASMLVGALGGLRQSNIKRLLAYSSIGHVGFMLMGLALLNVSGTSAVLVYLIVYVFMSAGAFGVLLMCSRQGQGVERMHDLSGLSKSQPALAAAFALFLLSMAGIPPMAGFFGKLMVVFAAMEAGFIWLATIAVLISVVACYYYLKVIKIMYFDEAEETLRVHGHWLAKWALGVCALVTVAFFLVPEPIFEAARDAAHAVAVPGEEGGE